MFRSNLNSGNDICDMQNTGRSRPVCATPGGVEAGGSDRRADTAVCDRIYRSTDPVKWLLSTDVRLRAKGAQ